MTFEPGSDRYGLLDLIQVWEVLILLPFLIKQLPSGFTLKRKKISGKGGKKKRCETPQSDLSVWM